MLLACLLLAFAPVRSLLAMLSVVSFLISPPCVSQYPFPVPQQQQQQHGLPWEIMQRGNGARAHT